MSGILNTRRTIATALMITVAATALAAPALAVDPTPEQSHLLLQSSDLPASSGKPTEAAEQPLDRLGPIGDLRIAGHDDR